MNNTVEDFTNNVQVDFCKETGMHTNYRDPNLLSSIAEPEGDLAAVEDGVSNYSHESDPLNTVNEEMVPVVGETDPVEAYIKDFVLRLGEHFLYFDGTIKSFRKCPGAALESIVVEQPNGAEGFSFEWFGIALTIVREVLKYESRLKKDLTALSPLPIGIYKARAFLVASLGAFTPYVIKGWRRLYYPSNPYEDLPQVRSIGMKIFDDWVALGRFPDSISSRYSNALPDTLINSLQDLEILLMADVGAWIASFFPIYHTLSHNTCVFTNPIWLDELLDQSDVEEFAYQTYTLCSQRSLLKNKDGLFRGVAVPRSWLTELLCWLTQFLQHSGEERDMASIPGPINTFPYMKVDLHNPSKHWLLPETKSLVDVIPERLFCLFSQFFGSGIKYIMYGDFTLRDEFLRMLKPSNLTIEVSFCWFQNVDSILEEKNVHVFVENVLHRTDITEVIRLAYQIVKKEEDAMTAEQLQFWAAATNGPGTLSVRAKHLNSEFLMIPVNIEFCTSGLTMASLVKMMTDHLGEQVELTPRQGLSIGIELQLRTAETGQEAAIGPLVTPQTVSRCGLCGLTNVGNTCYMNSALQCLSNMPHFRDRILYFPVSHYTNAPLTSSVVSLLTEMWSGLSECAKTATLNNILGHKVKRFTGYQQQDACEFVEVLLDRIQEELNEVYERCYRERLDTDKSVPLAQLSEIFWNSFLENNTSFISQDFFHQSKTVFTCLTCEEKSIVFDNNVSLSLNIREIETHNTIVVVQKPSLCAPGKTKKGNSAGPMLANLVDQVVCVSLNAYVVDGGRGGASEVELKKVIRNALRGCSELGKKMSSDLAIDVASTEETNEFDYHVEILEVPMKGCGKVVAWARCRMHRITECSSNFTPADAKQKEEANLESLLHYGGYRIWYFLKCDNSDSQTVRDVPIYVEEIPLSFSYTEGFFSPSNVSTTGRERKYEGMCVAQEDGLNSSRPKPAPFSDHILTLGRHIAQNFLISCSREYQGSSLPSAAMVNRHADTSVFSPLERRAKGKDVVPLKVMHYFPAKSLLVDIDEYSKTDGDAWLEELRAQHTIRAKRRKKHKLGPIAHCGFASTSKITNVSIFLCFKSDCFRAKVPHITMKSNSQRFCSTYLKLSNHGENHDTGAMCTLYDCLEESMMSDTLTDDNSWYCPHCKNFREARVQRSVFRVPPCLIISFKAFRMINAYHADKNNTPVDFPLQFDFSPYLDVESESLKQDTTYRLCGVVYHTGSLNFGHYTAYAFNDNIRKWVYFNDSHSYVMEIEKPPCIGAYMLFYERIGHVKS